MAPPIRVALATLCAGFAAWQLGAGAAIALKAAVAQQLLHAAWQRTQAGEREVRPWPWADTWPVARLLAPAQNVDLIVLEGASGRILAFGPGHVEGTAAPGGRRSIQREPRRSSGSAACWRRPPTCPM